ncbi:MAG: glucodextranase DOMON-like domain-containing protein [Candidatus Hodarchaeales archaeon]|jgi:alpha-amylase/alpha-mannosidase (GH57 family)
MNSKIRFPLISLFLLFLFLIPTVLGQIDFAEIDNKLENSKIDAVNKLAASKPLLVNIVWHQHQPVYVNPATNQAELPWVYMHAIKDYKYMADIIPDGINVSMDLTGSLLSQLLNYNDYMNKRITGEFTDKRIELALTPVENMTYEDKVHVFNYFFDINGQFVGLSGRYSELANKANTAPNLETGVNSFSDRDWQDLKALFFLFWMNFDYLIGDAAYGVTADPVLNEFFTYYTGVSTGNPKWSQPFTEDNITYIIEYGLNITEDVLPAHKDKIDNGNLEVITSPLTHPILPLLINLTSARDTHAGNFALPLPENNTLWLDDALAQVQLGNDLFEQIFNVPQVGLWPSEQSVSPAMIPLVNQTGIEWLISDQQQLQKVHPDWDDSANQTMKDHILYQPYIITDAASGKSTTSVYRNTYFSDLIGFQYSGLSPAGAAADFVNKLKEIYDGFNASSTSDEIKNTQHVVTVALDGENAWEHYQFNNEFSGNDFLRAFYNSLKAGQDAGWMETITMGQYLDQYGTSDLTEIVVQPHEWCGSWIGGDYNTWIGEEDENQAWDRLITARNALVEANTTDPNYTQNSTIANYTRAWEILYQAEGSDWWWWYGSDQNSGRDELFDWIYKLLLRGIYSNIGLSDEEILQKYPYLFVKVKGAISASVDGYVVPSRDGVASVDEWDIGAYNNDFENDTNDLIKAVYTGYEEDGQNLHLRIDPGPAAPQLSTADNLFYGIYFTSPRSGTSNTYVRYQPITVDTDPLGIEIAWEIAINFTGSAPTSFDLYKADGNNGWIFNKTYSTIAIDEIIELTIPFGNLEAKPVDSLQFNIVGSSEAPLSVKDQAPEDGPWNLVVPSGSLEGAVVFTIEDTIGDDSIMNPANDGSLSQVVYPNNAIFDPGYGHFDINSFTVAKNPAEGMNIFQISFETPELVLDTSWSTPTFTLPYTQVYVDIDRIPGSGRTDTIQQANMRVEENHAWEFMVNMEGGPTDQYVLWADETRVDMPNKVVGDTIAKSVTASFDVNIANTGYASEEWAYTVVVGSKDFNWMRSINAAAALWTLGGGSDSSWDPNVVDMLVPEGKDQVKLMAEDVTGTGIGWKDGEYLATAMAVGPGITYDIDLTPPNVSIIAPTDDATITGTGDSVALDIIYSAVDNKQLAWGQVYLNQILIMKITGIPSNFTFNWYINGDYTLTIVWYDVSDNSATAMVNFTVSGLTEGDNPFFEVIVPGDAIIYDFEGVPTTTVPATVIYLETSVQITQEETTVTDKSAPAFEFIISLLALGSLILVYRRKK